jgi:peptide/nickel transport system substrate-binding protein
MVDNFIDCHPAIPQLWEEMRAGLIDRRSFLRRLAWLGVSAAAAGAWLGGKALAAEPNDPPRSGGSLRFVCSVQQMIDPALVVWIEASNILRNSLEFLTYVDADNVTHPYLAASWTPSADLKTWDFTLQDGVIWSNGDDFTSEDVAFNIRRWIDPASQSSNRSAFSAVRDVEITGPLTLRLHLVRPLCALPEMLAAHSCAILHRRFELEGGNWPKNPVGTGPFSLVEFKVSRLAHFKRRDGYWGRPAFLDELHYVDLGTDIATHIAALSAGQVDVLYRVNITELDLVAKLPHLRLLEERSAQTLVLRMQCDQKPYDDIRVRRAVLLAADNRKMLSLAFRDRGLLGDDYHVASIQPDHADLPPQPRDVAKARALLAEAGYPDGIDLTLSLGNTQGRWEQDTAQVLQQSCREAGIRLTLDLMPAAEYWGLWNKVPFGISFWAHRPQGIMTLDLAYRSGSPWNESHFSDPAFDAALDHAMGILDPTERVPAMRVLETILRDQAVMVQPFFGNKFTAVSDRVRGFRAHPSEYYRMDGVWLA